MGKYTHETLDEYLFNRISIDPVTDCWNWTKKCNKDGYGYACWLGDNSWKAHQLSYTHFKGPIINQVNHICYKNPKCINPHHLYDGTLRENTYDSIIDGTYTHGERHGCAKLTEKEVKEIRNSDKLVRELAQQYGVSRDTIRDIKGHRTWKHLL